MPREDELFFEHAIHRIFRLILFFAGTGTLAALVLDSWRGGLGFLVGSAAAALNFYWLHRFVEALTPGGRRPRKLLMAAIALRYLLLGAAGYAIVKIFGISLIAVLVGLFVPVAAVIFEILYELVYAGT